MQSSGSSPWPRSCFFLVVKPLNVMAERRKRGQEPEEDAPPTEAELLIEIRDLLAARR